METKVAVFDDNPARLDGLKILIDMTQNMRCVGTFQDCSRVIEDIRNCQPDIVLMDIDMPKVNGIDGVKLIRSHLTDIKVLMQTVFEDEEKILASICAGADGYILKTSSPNDLVSAINEVMNGGAPMTPSVARQVLKFLKMGNSETPKSDFDLTSREHEILSLLVKGYSYKMVADACHVSKATVSTHVQHIYEKLQVHSVVEAVTKAIAHKIV